MSNIILRNQQHASRLFVDDHFRLAPKHKFLFHIAFTINPSTCKDASLVQRHKNEINMLVKNADLPNYSVKTETLNQYNRKKNVQYTHQYNPINITFHDDNMGVINKLWENYYNYYYADPSSAVDPGAYDRNAMKKFSYIKNAYGFDNGSKLPFFKKITMYMMARKEYVSYTLYNPIISRWNHNKVDYASGDLHDNSMEVMYEAVSYKSGKVSEGDPLGFALEHYDLTPSPNKSASGGVKGGGAGSSSLAANSSSPSFTNAAPRIDAPKLANLTSAVNTYQNTAALPLGGTTGVITNAVAGLGSGSTGGIAGIAFPKPGAPPNGTKATQVKLKY